MDLLSKEIKFIHDDKIIPSFEIPEVASSVCEDYIGNIGEMKIAVMKCRMGAAGPGSAAGVVRDAVKVLTPYQTICILKLILKTLFKHFVPSIVSPCSSAL